MSSDKFVFEKMVGVRMGFSNGFDAVSLSHIGVLKSLMGGIPVTMRVKFSKPKEVARTPIVVTANHLFVDNLKDCKDKEEFNECLCVHKWREASWLRHLAGQLHPLVWGSLTKQFWHNTERVLTKFDLDAEINELIAQERNDSTIWEVSLPQQTFISEELLELYKNW